jgi:hypothetical protein
VRGLIVHDEEAARSLLFAELEDEIHDWEIEDLAELLDYARWIALTEPHERAFRRAEN